MSKLRRACSKCRRPSAGLDRLPFSGYSKPWFKNIVKKEVRATRNKMFLSVALIACFTVLVPASKASANGIAAGNKEEYKSPGATRKILLSEPSMG